MKIIEYFYNHSGHVLHEQAKLQKIHKGRLERGKTVSRS